MKMFIMQAAVGPVLFGLSSAVLGNVTIHELHPSKITCLVAEEGLAEAAGGLILPRRRQAKRWWCKLMTAEASCKWKVNAPKKEEYLVTALIKGAPGDKITLKSDVDELSYNVPRKDWERYELGFFELDKGVSSITLKPDSLKGILELKSLELIRKEALSAYRKRVEDFKAAGKDAFKDIVYGVMFTYGKWVFDPEGNQKPWPQQYADLDMEKVADMVEETGAEFVIWSLTWADYYVPAPIKAVEDVLPGRSTIKYGGEDYVGKLADALNKRGIKLILYYHIGHGDRQWWPKAAGVDARGKSLKNYGIDDSVFEENWKKIIGEMGERYGNRLFGWWFDDGIAYYPVDFEEFGAVARKGNPNRVITYNNWKVAGYTEFQDYMSGENHRAFNAKDLKDGVLLHGKDKGLRAFGLFRTENDWAVHRGSKKIVVNQRFIDAFPGLAERARKNKYFICYNLMMYEDGSIAPESLEGVKKAKRFKIRKLNK